MVVSNCIEQVLKKKYKDRFNYLKFYIIYNLISIGNFGLYLCIKYFLNIYFNKNYVIYNKGLFTYHLVIHITVQVLLYFIIHTIRYIRYRRRNNKNENIIKQTIGMRIKNARLNKNMNKTEFARLVDVNAKTITRWENDESIPNCEFVKIINSILEIDLNEDIIEKNNNIFEIKTFFIHFNLFLFVILNISDVLNGIYYTIYYDLYPNVAFNFRFALLSINLLYRIIGIICFQIFIYLLIKFIIHLRERRVK